MAYGVLDEEIDRLADKYWQRVSPKKSDNFYDIYEAKKQTATVENSLSQSNKEATNK